MFSEKVLDHFQNPRNAGDLPDATATAEVENPACGDQMRLQLKVQEDRIAAVRFRVRGCVASIACGSALTELVLGKELSEVKKLSRQDVVQAVGGLSAETKHASHLAMDALAEALKVLDASGSGPADQPT